MGGWLHGAIYENTCTCAVLAYKLQGAIVFVGSIFLVEVDLHTTIYHNVGVGVLLHVDGHTAARKIPAPRGVEQTIHILQHNVLVEHVGQQLAFCRSIVDISTIIVGRT